MCFFLLLLRQCSRLVLVVALQHSFRTICNIEIFIDDDDELRWNENRRRRTEKRALRESKQNQPITLLLCALYDSYHLIASGFVAQRAFFALAVPLIAAVYYLFQSAGRRIGILFFPCLILLHFFSFICHSFRRYRRRRRRCNQIHVLHEFTIEASPAHVCAM